MANATPNNRSRRPRLLYGEGNSSPNTSQQQLYSTNENKGLGISNRGNGTSTTGGIRAGMTSLGLTPSNASSTNNNNHSSSTDRSNTNNNSTNNNNGTNTSRMTARRNRRV